MNTDEDTLPEQPEVKSSTADFIFHDVVDEEEVALFLSEFEKTLDEGVKDITLHLTSHGGDLFEAFGAYDRIRLLLAQHEATLTVVASGYVMSAGTVLLAAGDKRISLPHTVFMLHEPWQYPWEEGKVKIHSNEMRARSKLHALSVNHLVDIFTRRFGTTLEQWDDLVNLPNDMYFDAQDAVRLGLVHEIWEEP